MQQNRLAPHSVLAIVLTTVALLGPLNVDADTPLFADHDLLEIELTGAITTIIRDTEDRERRPLTLRIGDRTIDVEARVRGKSRAVVCDFPPLKLYFDSDGDADGTVFEGQDSLKLITHCYNSESGDRYMQREYVAFRIFQTLTDIGYDARLARIHYNDTDGKLANRARHRLAVFIESDEGLAARLGGEIVETLKFRRSELDESHAALVYVFEYLIGNNDWATTHTSGDDKCCHNLDMVRVDEKLYFVPFDFDLSGLVDASYAENRPGAQVIREERRSNKIHCVGEERLGDAVEHVLANRDAIEAEIDAVPEISEKDLKKLKNYMARFDRAARKEGRIPRAIDTRCL